MARANAVVTSRWDGDICTITVLGAGSITFDRTAAHVDLRDRAERHGWDQRFADAAAIPRDTKTGRSATPEQKFAAVKARVDWVASGTDQWSMKGSGKPDPEALLAELDDAALEALMERVRAKRAAASGAQPTTEEAASE